MSLTLLSGPTAPVITLTQAKLWLRVDHGEEDELIEGLVDAARQHVERRTRRQIGEQSWRLRLNGFTDPVCVPLHPLRSITSIASTDALGASTTLASSAYRLVPGIGDSRIRPALATSWPAATTVTIEVVAGYGGDMPVPAPLMQAIRLLFAHYYENRQAAVNGSTVASIDMGVAALCASYVVPVFR